MLIAQCDCGFRSNLIYVGGGMMNFNGVLDVPALCKRCQTLVVKNYLEHDPICPHCGGMINFYNDPGLFKGQLPKEENGCLFYWRLPDNFDSNYSKIDNFFCLPKTDYMCPHCGEINMKFVENGFWD
jgi:Zn finger protein HypA/HybF involved in hydrogenase expression